ncbi:MAG TPA: flippase, partial [Gemmatimonadaceae bacterium]|nr:flippase [Gemmatimonadaceae bacterium]
MGESGLVRSRVAHNTLLNFLGLAVPLALAFFVMPVAARHLGPARFGLLGLAWAITEYLTLFDLGLGRAIVKFVADALHHDSDELSEIVSVSLYAQLAGGIVGGAAFALAAPALVHDVFRLPPETASEAIGVFRVVGLSLPAVLLISAQRGILEGAQRFDLSTSIKMLSSVASLSIPAIGAVRGASLPSILLVVLASRLVICALYAFAIRRALPAIRWVRSRGTKQLRRVLSFGGWVLVSNSITPLLLYFDRFALGSIIGLAAVGFYTAPYEGVTRLLLIPVSLIGSLLPALSSLEAQAERERFGDLTSTSMRALMVVMAAPLAVVFVFAPDLLRVWLGADYADQAATALRILAIGVFTNALAHPLFISLYAKNRPDLPARFHLIELVIHVPLTIWLIRTFGIAGAAAAWTTRVTLDTCLLLWAASRVAGSPAMTIAGGRVGRTLAAVVVLLIALFAARSLAVVSVVGAVA